MSLMGVYSNWAGESKLESTKALPATSANRMEMVGIHSLFLFFSCSVVC